MFLFNWWNTSQIEKTTLVRKQSQCFLFCRHIPLSIPINQKFNETIVELFVQIYHQNPSSSSVTMMILCQCPSHFSVPKMQIISMKNAFWNCSNFYTHANIAHSLLCDRNSCKSRAICIVCLKVSLLLYFRNIGYYWSSFLAAHSHAVGTKQTLGNFSCLMAKTNRKR